MTLMSILYRLWKPIYLMVLHCLRIFPQNTIDTYRIVLFEYLDATASEMQVAFRDLIGHGEDVAYHAVAAASARGLGTTALSRAAAPLSPGFGPSMGVTAFKDGLH